jgi:methylated-DNA-[protein]-cysteine S-methyltransferase
MKSLAELLCRIPNGKVTTYLALARRLGVHPRAVGMMLNRNAHPVIIPCHRVVHADGSLGGYANGSLQKERLLRFEGIEIKKGKIDLDKHLFRL